MFNAYPLPSLTICLLTVNMAEKYALDAESTNRWAGTLIQKGIKKKYLFYFTIITKDFNIDSN